MKQLFISVALILVLTGPAFGMGWFGGHGGSSQDKGGTAVTSSSDNGTNKAGSTDSGSASMSLPEPSSIFLLAFSGAVVFYAIRRLKSKSRP